MPDPAGECTGRGGTGGKGSRVAAQAVVVATVVSGDGCHEVPGPTVGDRSSELAVVRSGVLLIGST